MIELRTGPRERLHSIVEDANFIALIASDQYLPLVANERCGRWYIPPWRQAESAYFKSTDGHVGQYAFSKRRLNLHLLETIGKNNGLVLVRAVPKGCLLKLQLLSH